MKIYIYLKNEGTHAWRPVEAQQIGLFYRISESKKDETEEWEFGSGDLVSCEEREFEDGTKRLVAVKKL